MSISYQITPTGDIDGATTIDVTNFITDARGVRQVAHVGDGGLVELNTIPGLGFADAWVQVAFITQDDGAATPDYILWISAETDRQTIPINAAAFGWFDSPWNIFCPQNSRLTFTLTGGAAQTGSIYFNLWPIDHEVWPELNAPHAFSNLPTPLV